MPGPFQAVQVGTLNAPNIRRRYSLTADIVAFRRCARQYGHFKAKSFAPAEQTQLYFGHIIHQVLDRCHSHFQGIQDPRTAGTIPDNGNLLADVQIEGYFQALNQTPRGQTPLPAPSEIVGFFIEVENGLKSQGIRAVTPDLRTKAVRVLQYFNRVEGPNLYGRVVDTECRLQSDQANHVLHGVVDLLAEQPGGGGREIWDYKGKTMVGLTQRELANYTLQMQVYARLHELKFGVLPDRAVLYFVNELDGATCPTTRPVNALMEVPLDPAEIQTAMQEFGQTVQDIETARQNDQWPPAAVGALPEQDCSLCSLRWDCPTPNNGQGVAMRYP
jgi:hypothetical protein